MAPPSFFKVAAALAALQAVYAAPAAPGMIAMGAQDIVAAQTPITNTTAVLKRNCAYWGWYPDDGQTRYGSEGQFQTLQELNQNTGTPAFAVGAYAHIYSPQYVRGNPATYFNGSELTPYLQQALLANATFVASISPIYGFQGFLNNDTTQAQAVVAVLKTFVDAGVTVWLRWAHEMNWYFTKGSDDENPNGKGSYYVGTPAQYIEAWKVMYNTIKPVLPSVRFFWSPNVDSNDGVRIYWPGPQYVDIVGMDYYVEKNAPNSSYYDIVSVVKNFHDEFALPYGFPFFLAETGTRTNSTDLNLAFIKTVTSAATCRALPQLYGIFWFHYIKNYIDHYLVTPPTAPVAQQFRTLMASSG